MTFRFKYEDAVLTITAAPRHGTPGSGRIEESTLHQVLSEPAADAVESLMLALICEGVITASNSQAAETALATTLDAFTNNG